MVETMKGRIHGTMRATRSEMLVILLFFLDIATPEVLLSSQRMLKQEHDDAAVICRSDVDGEYVQWFKERKKIRLGETTTPVVTQRKYGLLLTFNDIKKEDAGIYICKSQDDRAEFELTVHSPLIFVNTDSEVTGAEGEYVYLRCDVQGATQMEWLVNGESIAENPRFVQMSDGLVIRNATWKDADNEYVCKAINEQFGVEESRTVNLTIKHKPKRYSKQEFVYGYIGDVVELKCEVLAVPPANITWYRRGKKNVTGRVIHQDLPKVSISILKLVLKEPSDLGDYRCVAANSEGTLIEYFKVLPGGKPEHPISMSVGEITAQSVTLMVEVPPPTKQENIINMAPTGVRIEYRPKDQMKQWEAISFTLSEDNMYSVPNLTTNKIYQVRAATENLAGFSDFIDPIEFTTSYACTIHAQVHLIIVFSVLIISFNNSFSRLI